jgi:acyl carrier protein
MTIQAGAIFSEVAGAIRRLSGSGDLPPFLREIELSPETRVDAIGLDSLGQVLLLEEVTGVLACYVPGEDWAGVETLGQLSEAILRSAAA